MMLNGDLCANNILHPTKEFSWSHIYSVTREAGSSEFRLVFYVNVNEEPERTEEHCASTEFQFAIVTLKAKDVAEVSDLMAAMYKAVESQAVMATNTAAILTSSKVSQQAEAAEDYFRLAVDLWTFSRGCYSSKVIEAQQHLINFLKTQESAGYK